MFQNDEATTRKSLIHGAATDGWNQFEQLVAPQTRSLKAMHNRVQMITQHMAGQWQQHELALRKTNLIFEELLKDLEPLTDSFHDNFAAAKMPSNGVFFETDSDRSVGILNIQWHAVSFTLRGNTKPFALNRSGRDPLFTGRIIALHGDYHQLASDLNEMSFPELLEFELASLYVPADEMAPAVMRVRHLNNEEQFFHQSESARMFLLKTIEMVCGGGFFHEREY